MKSHLTTYFVYYISHCVNASLFYLIQIGLDDCGKISERDALLLRMMMPVAKMYTAKRCMEVVSEGLECFGGQGYIEDTGLPGGVLKIVDCLVDE